MIFFYILNKITEEWFYFHAIICYILNKITLIGQSKRDITPVLLQWNMFPNSHSWRYYPQTSNISDTSVGNKIVDHSDAVGASPVGAAPTTSSLSPQHLASMDWAKTTARCDEKHSSFGIWCAQCWRFDGILVPCHAVKLLQSMWSLSPVDWNLWVPNPEMSRSDFT